MLANSSVVATSLTTPPATPSAPLPAAVASPTVFPHHTEAIPPGTIEAGAYLLRFAWSRADLHAAQALRWRVFTQELGEGQTSAVASTDGEWRDVDERDPWFHHLLVVHRDSGDVVGTYRLQTAVMAATRHGLYSATLFELGAMPLSVLEQSVEVGRACVDARHRSGRVLRLLWKGLARYLQWNSKRYLFGCCSLTGTDAVLAHDAWRTVHARGALHDTILVRPHAEVSALPDVGRHRPTDDEVACTPALPPLFEGYLNLGAKVCGAPAVDREFGTTDFLVLLDVNALDERTWKSFFG
jgi:putative hemolysin